MGKFSQQQQNGLKKIMETQLTGGIYYGYRLIN